MKENFLLILYLIFTMGYHRLKAETKSSSQIIYDSNPFLLSDSQINNFLSGKDSAFKTYDDLIGRTTFNFFSSPFGEMRLGWSFVSNLFFQNPKKSYLEIGCHLRRYFGKLDRYGEMGYKFVPNYLIRPIKKGGRFLDLSYSAHFLEGRGKLKAFEFLFAFSYENYPQDFEFYDAGIYSFGFSWTHRTSSLLRRFDPVRITFGLKGKRCLARGDLPDISYQGMEFLCGIKGKRFDFALTGEWRGFTTEIDERHRGRRDLIGKASLSFSFPLGRRSSFLVNYEFKIRETTAEIVEESEVRDYRKHRIGIGVEYAAKP